MARDLMEYELKFYIEQNQIMTDRYRIIFQQWDLSFDKYFNYVCKRLHNKTYWIWIFLCGLEQIIQQENEKTGRRKRLYNDAKIRTEKIIGNYFVQESYVRSL